MSDGTRVLPDLIYQNYYIDITKVNKSMQLPDLFIVKPPFGDELMQVYVSDRPFSSFRIVSRLIGGERYRVVDGYERNVRGMGVKGSESQVVSGRIKLTTVDRLR